MADSIPNPIAERRLSLPEDPERTAVVTVGAPYHEVDGVWACDFAVEDVGGSTLRTAHGEDSMQALLMAFEGARVTLSASGVDFTWLGEPGNHGIQRFIPMFLPFSIVQDIERYIDERVAAFGKDAQTRTPG
jgi:hypothetical protein